MKNIFLLSMMSLAMPAQGAIYNYDKMVPPALIDYLDDVVLTANDVPPNPQCASKYDKMIEDGVLDIHYSLGYFDDSQGVEIIFAENMDGTGVKNYGLSPSLDIEIFHAIRSVFTSNCGRRHQQLCEFQSAGDPRSGKVVLEKRIDLQGRPITVRITLTHASASENYVENQTTLKERQAFLTKQSETNFFEAIRKGDIVFYNGHSRDGGGPDFNPPRLNRHKKADYNGYYKVKKVGITRVLKEIENRKDKNYILGIYACYSYDHYHKALFKLNPKLKVALSIATIDYFDSLFASTGYLEGILHGSCGADLTKIARQKESVVKGYKAFHF